MDIDKKEKSQGINIQPPIPGEYANWVSVNSSELQAIVDFGFIQPAPKGKPKSGIIIKRIILPLPVAEELGKILFKMFNKKNEDKTNTK